MKKYFARRRVAILGVASVALLCTAYLIIAFSPEKENFAPAGIVGVQHLGPTHGITEFYANKAWGGNVGREGGGGGVVCCVMLPWSWRPGLLVEVRWEVWADRNQTEVNADNSKNKSIKKMYIANVPVEEYGEPGDLYVHFFPNGRVRVVSTMYSVLSTYHPVPYGPGEGGQLSTAGQPIKEFFTKAEMADMEKKARNTWR